jgi:hypothetical protein
MQWIRSELVEWVYGNLMNKWDVIIRKGRRKVCATWKYCDTQRELTNPKGF